MTSVTVLGGGNTAFAVAANLSLRGHEITLFELPEQAANVAAIQSSRQIVLKGVAERGTATLRAVTTDVGEAVAASDLMLLIVPAYAHRPFAEQFARKLTPGKTIVLMPGTLGSLEWAKVLRSHRTEGVVLAEVDTAPYVCRKTGPAEATIWGEVTGLGLGVLPARDTERVLARMAPLFPGISAHPDVAACGLSSINPVIHPAGVLMNAGRIEYSRGEFYFYEEGVSPSVAKVVSRIDQERLEIGRALGHQLTPVAEAFHQAGFGPAGDLWSTINGSLMLTRLKAPGNLESRWMTEDLPYGIATWVSLAEQLGVETPLMRSFIEIGSVVLGADARAIGRDCEDLGIEALTVEQFRTYLVSGRFP
ncbi:MAG: dehydrogenase [SAR202 cluster bacterium]|nr:dehydrogenase [SAR202 cluster bacterium]